jgi:hypothetical protein
MTPPCCSIVPNASGGTSRESHPVPVTAVLVDDFLFNKYSIINNQHNQKKKNMMVIALLATIMEEASFFGSVVDNTLHYPTVTTSFDYDSSRTPIPFPSINNLQTSTHHHDKVVTMTAWESLETSCCCCSSSSDCGVAGEPLGCNSRGTNDWERACTWLSY